MRRIGCSALGAAGLQTEKLRGAGHLRAAYGHLTWCVRCGSYAERWAVGLAAPCKGQPSNQSQRRVWRRLWAGRHPRTNERFAEKMLLEAATAGASAMAEQQAGGQPMRRTGAGASGSLQPRSTAGYLRRPGGGEAAFKGGSGGSELAVEGGGSGDGVRKRARDPLEERRLITVMQEALAHLEGTAGVEAKDRTLDVSQEAPSEEGRVDAYVQRKALLSSLRARVNVARQRQATVRNEPEEVRHGGGGGVVPVRKRRRFAW